MQTQVPATQTGRDSFRPNPGGAVCIALDENELSCSCRTKIDPGVPPTLLLF